MFYLLAILYVYLVIFQFRKLPLPLLISTMLPLIIFSTMRGSSGKDSAHYLHRFYNQDITELTFSFFFSLREPILDTIIFICRSTFSSHEFFYFCHALVLCILFSLALKKYDYLRLYFISIGPMFLIDGLTNGMRVALAYHFLLVAVTYKFKYLFFITAFLSHLSSIITILTMILFNAFKTTLVKKFQICSFAGAFFLMIYFFGNLVLFNDERLTSKLNQYSTLILDTKYSGLADLAVLFLLIFTISFTKFNILRSIKFFIFAIVICLAFYGLVQNTLAGIRIIKMVNIGIFLSSITMSNRSKEAHYAFFLIGIFYSLNYLRQVFFTVGTLPYPGPL